MRSPSVGVAASGTTVHYPGERCTVHSAGGNSFIQEPLCTTQVRDVFQQGQQHQEPLCTTQARGVVQQGVAASGTTVHYPGERCTHSAGVAASGTTVHYPGKRCTFSRGSSFRNHCGQPR
jgi:hypothetical protein